MAAILCQSITTLCSGIGHVIALPCRLCGTACGSCCQVTGQLLSSPFAPYLITTLALNIPSVVWGLRSAIQQAGMRCSGDSWLWFNAVLCFAHIAAAFYIVQRLREDLVSTAVPTEDPEEGPPPQAPPASSPSNTQYQTMHDETRNSTSKSSQAPTTLLSSITGLFDNNNKNATTDEKTDAKGSSSKATPAAAAPTTPGRSSFFQSDIGQNYDAGEAYSWQRLRQVLCYDIVVAVYIVLALIWIVWQSVGISRAIEAQSVPNQNLDGGYCDKVANWMTYSIVCGFLYASLVCLAFSCSVCCLRH